jgi:membrane protein required for colicin V production
MNVADLIIVIIVVIGFFSGLVRGFVRGLLGLVGLYAGIMIAAGYHQQAAASIFSFMPGDRAPDIVSFVLIFLAVIILVGIIARLIAKALKLAALGWLDRVLGGVLGAGIASVVVGIVLLLAVMAGLEESPALVNSRMAPRVLGVTDLVVTILPPNARAVVNEQYGKLRAEWEGARQREENLVAAPEPPPAIGERVV